jgi:hypothetical protein
MVSVVVDHHDAVHLAERLEPALGAAELAKRGGDAIAALAARSVIGKVVVTLD